MISSLTLKDFKAIKCANNIKISPITIICGKNSSGKSSIIQSLLLLKQTIDKPNITNSQLSLEGDFLHYSHLSDLSHNLPHANSAKIEYEFEIKTRDQITGRVAFTFRQSASILKSKLGPYLSEIKWSTNDEKYSSIKFSKDRLWITQTIVKALCKQGEEIDKQFKYSLKLYRFLPDGIIQVSNSSADQKEMRFNREGQLIKLCVELYDELKRITYSSPIRALPQRAYLQYSGQESELEADGRNMAQFLWQHKDRKIVCNGEKVSLIDGINTCLKQIGLDQTISVKRSNRMLYQLTVRINSKSEREVPISDVGFGYSQILPMIVNGLISRPNALTIYEQPEIHLHPSSAGSIADILIQFAKDDKRSIVETHSSELINKLRLRVVENPELCELINIVFVERDLNDSGTIRQFSFNKDGLPPDWPKGFLDESQMLAEQLVRARFSRKND